ncbi:GNAT family N-acetyltransferase [Rossellomorea sp. YZS02]|uniref:GNAT family N-acetyltransferase n=1 Tax=Rossellomorea sp. YZS02 TaxID=3097358 RepID=UPI002A0F66E0|nr:GNAT family N-acetyltransferase [Rossellomorea sp. YZS02]MDX8343580.1 GNAT family N-acetyltransferase [Rossellomorea sp. YZS02]
MSTVKIDPANIEDASVLTAVQKKVFDAERVKWFQNQTGIIDYNIQPPGYDSIEMNTYMIRELDYYKVFYEDTIVGGLIVTVAGKRRGRIDRIFIDPLYQGRGIGSQVLKIMEGNYPHVVSWELETSSLQLSNHTFYENLGFQKIFESHDEYCYEKKMNVETGPPVIQREVTIVDSSLKDVDLADTHVEHCSLEKTEFYGINGSLSTFSNSRMMGVQFSNCNLTESRFQNINFQRALLADLNLSHSEIAHVALGGVHIHDTHLGDAGEPLRFERCDLKKSKFQNCNLKNVDISDCDTSGMMIDGILVKDLLEAYAQRMKK